MKRLTANLLTILLLAGLSFALQETANAATFKGEIMDSPCAAMGSHDKGFGMTHTTTAKECTLACVSMMNGKFMLYDAAKKTAYELDDQEKAKGFAGEKVTISGTLNSKTTILKVAKIEASK
ncbi:MAG: hypothetical protein A3J28_17755 [Acidobacteria bacterium RIFCSPLOWO2_12_FULL_60_22]|nr:MAG: hypothetical protein A3J28_17755 [Acidobacteria bacterium RIFCSPLOWO2_12_FULL_60_22]